MCLCCAVQCHHERFRLCQLQNGLKALPTLRPECFGSLQAKIEASHVHVVSSAASTVTSGCSVYIGVEDVCSLTGGGEGKERKQDRSCVCSLLSVLSPLKPSVESSFPVSGVKVATEFIFTKECHLLWFRAGWSD